MPIDWDRTIHATITPEGGGERIEIVRYDRAGHWYAEQKGQPRKKLTLAAAAEYVREPRPGAVWHEGRYSGSRFDALVRKLRGADHG